MDPSEFCKSVYDYVVVGGGTTGLALATLLSNDPSVTVGVIEAGRHRNEEKMLIPGMVGSTLGDPEFNWQFSSTPQDRLNGRTLGVRRGKVLGGTSVLHFLCFMKGAQVEHDGWSSLGVSGWDWATIDRGIKLAEKYTPPTPDDMKANPHLDTAPETHGRHGYLATSPQAYQYDLELPFFETLNKLGIPTNTTSHNGDIIGISAMTTSVDPETRVRSYSTNAYYEPRATRKNLIVLTGAQATKVVLGEEKDRHGNFRATGVVFVAEDTTWTVSAKREVILCAGTIQTPQLLELSGIGSENILGNLGIDVKISLPGVGENLQEHFAVMVHAKADSKFTTTDHLADPDFAAAEMRRYTDHKTGMFSSTCLTAGFLPLNKFMDKARVDDILDAVDTDLKTEKHRTAVERQTRDLQRSWLNDEKVPQLEVVLFAGSLYGLGSANPRPPGTYYSICLILQHAFSRGNVHITSSDGLLRPAIDLKALEASGDFDLKVLVEAVRWSCRVTQTEPLASGTETLLIPPPDATQEVLEEYVRKAVNPSGHVVGTAAMMPREAGGVVDNTLKVYGTSNLRVVDASVFPVQLGTHPQATLYGFAHIAAELISSARSSD